MDTTPSCWPPVSASGLEGDPWGLEGILSDLILSPCPEVTMGERQTAPEPPGPEVTHPTSTSPNSVAGEALRSVDTVSGLWLLI